MACAIRPAPINPMVILSLTVNLWSSVLAIIVCFYTTTNPYAAAQLAVTTLSRKLDEMKVTWRRGRGVAYYYLPNHNRLFCTINYKNGVQFYHSKCRKTMLHSLGKLRSEFTEFSGVGSKLLFIYFLIFISIPYKYSTENVGVGGVMQLPDTSMLQT